MTTCPDPERIWLEPRVDGVPHDRTWADSDVWAAELDDPALVPTEYVRADLAAALSDRIARAIAALNGAPDIDAATPTKREVQATIDANVAAWAILTEGVDPPSRRRAEDAP